MTKEGDAGHHSASELLGDWRAAERDTAAARSAASVAALALEAAAAAEEAAEETEVAIRTALEAVERAKAAADHAKEAASHAAEAAQLLSATAEVDKVRANHAVRMQRMRRLPREGGTTTRPSRGSPRTDPTRGPGDGRSRAVSDEPRCRPTRFSSVCRPRSSAGRAPRSRRPSGAAENRSMTDAGSPPGRAPRPAVHDERELRSTSSPKKPSTPSRMISASPPTRRAMTGVPQASASIATSPNGSGHDPGISAA